MIKRICDCCGTEIKKEFVKFRINWNMASENDNGQPRNTYSLEYCENCFANLLGELGLEKNEDN